MNRDAIVGVFLTLLIFNIGCKNDPSVDDINISIDQDFKVLLWESLDGNFRSFHLNLETIDTTFCENTSIEIDPSTENGNISLTINNIPENTCLDAAFPATANFEIGELDIKEHNIAISLKEVVYNYGHLIVEEAYYELDMRNLDGITIPNKRLYRVPENTIWGFVAYEENASSSVADEFLEELDNFISEKIFQDGYYGFFSTQNNNLNILNYDIPHQSHTSFGYHFEGNADDLISLLNTFRTNYPDLEFKIFTSKGEVL